MLKKGRNNKCVQVNFNVVYDFAGAAAANNSEAERNVSQFQTLNYNLLNFFKPPPTWVSKAPCGDSQTKEMCKSDLMLLRECGFENF